MKIVLQKFIASTGYLSRRGAEELIKNKQVKVNGELAELGMRVDRNDDVRINGERLIIEDKVYVALNKPVGYTCTNRSFKGEENIFELIDLKERLFVVGRLDKNSRGLILLTNDGDMTQQITHPKYQHEKKYEALVDCGKMSIDKVVKYFKNGIDIGDGDGRVKAKDIKKISQEQSLNETKFEIILTEGKKRQIRRMFDKSGCEVLDLKRVQIGKIKLDDLKEGEYKYLSKENIF